MIVSAVAASIANRLFHTSSQTSGTSTRPSPFQQWPQGLYGGGSAPSSLRAGQLPSPAESGVVRSVLQRELNSFSSEIAAGNLTAAGSSLDSLQQNLRSSFADALAGWNQLNSQVNGETRSRGLSVNV